VAQEMGLMSQKEVTRLEVINRVMCGELAQGRAAQLLTLSVRQIKRLSRARQVWRQASEADPATGAYRQNSGSIS
jgi:hypothetical protein